MVWIAMLLTVCIVVILLYERSTAPKTQRSWMWLPLRIVVVVLVSPLAFYLFQQIIEHPSQEEERGFREASLSALREIRAALGDEDILKEFLALKYEKLMSSSREEATAWADALIKSLPDRAREIEGLEEVSDTLAARYRMKWEPLYSFVLQSLDSRIETLQNAGVVTSFQKRESPLLVREELAGSGPPIRVARFRDSYDLVMWLRPGVIQYGKVLNTPLLVFKEQNFAGPWITEIYFRTDEILLSAKGKYSGLRYRTQAEEPLSDETLRERVEAVINQAVTLAAVRGQAGTRKR